MRSLSVRRRIAGLLRETAGDSADFEADQILSYVFGGNWRLLLEQQESDPLQDERIAEILKRRESGEPLQYIFGEWSFMGFPFCVRPGTLIPRPETEILCEKAVSLIDRNRYRTVLDLCCGTGCIGISLNLITGADVTCSDIDPGCILLAGENAEKNNASVSLRQGDLFGAVSGESFDVICCNPPYLSDAEMGSLQREVRFEPALALCGGSDGLDYYRRIAEEYGPHLKPGGALLLEIGAGQADAVSRLFPGAERINDYAGIPRLIVFQRG